MIEINPFNDYDGCGTSGAMFDWKADHKVIFEGPFEFRLETGIIRCKNMLILYSKEE